MRLLKTFVLSVCLILAACAGNRQKTDSPGDYVEIDNPARATAPTPRQRYGSPGAMWRTASPGAASL